MVKAGTFIHTLHLKCINLNCLAHAFHRVVEEVCNEFSDADKVDKVVALAKKVFRKWPIHIKTFLTLTNNETLLVPEPIIT